MTEKWTVDQGASGKLTREVGICPHLGFEDDPETALAYPAAHNFCYHCKPISPVVFDHQREFCLTPEYLHCPVYQTTALEPLPRDLRGKRRSNSKSHSYLSILILCLVLLLGLAVAILLGLIKLPGNSAAIPVIVRDETPSQIATFPAANFTATVTATPTIRPTITQEIEVPTPSPHALETPFGVSPKLVIHQVREGEGFIRLAEQYGTTAEAIKAINFELPETLFVDTILVIPLNTDDVTGLPRFSLRQINTEGLTIESYAERMSLDAQALKKFNELPDGYVLQMGEWLLIPNP